MDDDNKFALGIFSLFALAAILGIGAAELNVNDAQHARQRRAQQQQDVRNNYPDVQTTQPFDY